MTLTKIDDRGLKTPIDLLDNEYLRLGTGNDLELFHNGNHSFIQDVGTGNLYINSMNGNIHLRTSSNEQAVTCVQNAEVVLYHNNSRKLETASYGALVTGTMSAGSGNFDVSDNGKFKAGNSSDLQIYHSGTDSIIDNTQGELQITTDAVMRFNATEYKFNNAANNEKIANFFQDGACELYFNHSKKFETTSTGITVSGNISIGDGDELRLGDGNDLIIKHDSANTYISNQTGELVLNGDIIRLRKGDGLEDHLKCFANGSVELYQNGTKRFETTSSGINVVGAITVNGSAFTGGKILQVLQTVKTNTFSLSTNDVDTNIPGLSVDITPTSTSSKIFVSCTWEHSSDHTNSFAMFFLRRIVSGTTNNICFGDSRGSSIQCTRSHMRVQNLEAKCSNIEFLDSPNTTSQVTYTLALRNAHQGTILVGGTSATDDDNRTSTPSVITVREVSA